MKTLFNYMSLAGFLFMCWLTGAEAVKLHQGIGNAWLLVTQAFALILMCIYHIVLPVLNEKKEVN